MAQPECVRCSKSHSCPQAFLLKCSKCHRLWHHRCHIPPVEDDELITRIQATNNNDIDGGLDGWACRRCLKKAKGVHNGQLRPYADPRSPPDPHKVKSSPKPTEESRPSVSLIQSHTLPPDVSSPHLNNADHARDQAETNANELTQNLSCQGLPSSHVQSREHHNESQLPSETALPQRHFQSINPKHDGFRPSNRLLVARPSIDSTRSSASAADPPSSDIDELGMQMSHAVPITSPALNFRALHIADEPVSQGADRNLPLHSLQSESMDIEVDKPVTTSNTFSPPHMIPNQTRNFLAAGPSNSVHDTSKVPPVQPPKDTQMDVDDDIEDLYWTPPPEYLAQLNQEGFGETHRLPSFQARSPTPNATEPIVFPPAPPPRPPTPVQDELLTTWACILHADDWNSGSSQRSGSVPKHKYKPNKTKANKLESSETHLLTFTQTDWLRNALSN